jgi:hypothetical protein
MSSANPGPVDPSLPPVSSTETSLKRDDWMLMSPSTVIVAKETSGARLVYGDDSLIENYGDTSQATRNMSGGADFFSSLGTEAKKKKGLLDRPDVPQVRHNPPSL